MMTRFLLSAVILATTATAGAAELVVNGGFEQPAAKGTGPAAWSGDPAVFSLDREVKRSGQASLKYENSDANRYRLAGQKVPLQPGRKYRVSAWSRPTASPDRNRAPRSASSGKTRTANGWVVAIRAV